MSPRRLARVPSMTRQDALDKVVSMGIHAYIVRKPTAY